jgi:hypothetical protein
VKPDGPIETRPAAGGFTRAILLFILLLAAVPAAIYVQPGFLALRVYISQREHAVALPARPEARTLAEAQAQDLADLRMLPGLDHSFSPETRAAFERGVDALDSSVGRMSPARFWMEISRLVALAANGHTSVNVAQRAASFGRIPLRLAWFADGLYVVRATPDHADLLGCKITAIDGRSTAEAMQAARPYFSGTDQRAKALDEPLLESPALLQVMWPDTDGETLAIEAVCPAGVARNIVLTALPPRPDRFAGQPLFEVGPLPNYGDFDWKTVLSHAPALPLSLADQDHVAFSRPLEGDGLYVRINANGDDVRGRLADQLAAIAATRPAHGWRWIVLDVRFNGGGDELKTMAFTRALPTLLSPNGDLFVLVDNATFSAAIIIAARARHFLGRSRTRIVGEPMGDHPWFWTDGGPPLVLRNSGIEIGRAYFRHDWAHGCLSLRDCHPYQFLFGVAAGDLTPDVTVGWRFADYAAGRDTVMDAVTEMERSARR